MIPLAKTLLVALGGAVLWETGVQVKEHVERHDWYNWSREYCDSVGKPLLTVGLQRGTYNPPNGDSVIDVDPEVLDVSGGVLASVTALPFPDKKFGIAYNSHVLEHLSSPEDIEAAIAECRRVADYAVLLAPSPYSIMANLFCPSHNYRLWMDSKNNKVVVKPSSWQTGIGVNYGGAVKQTMFTYNPLPMPAVIQG